MVHGMHTCMRFFTPSTCTTAVQVQVSLQVGMHLAIFLLAELSGDWICLELGRRLC